MKKLLLIFTIIFFGCVENSNASDKHQASNSIFFSAVILDIKKIHHSYPHLELAKVSTVAKLYEPSLWEKAVEYFKDPNKLSNNDIAYFTTTKDEFEKLKAEKCIRVRIVFSE